MNAKRLTLATVVVAIVVVAAVLLIPRFTSSGTSSAALSYDNQPVLGQADAPVTVAVFEDFLCPHCATFSEEVFPLVKRDYVDTGKAKMAFFFFPVVDPVQSRVLGGLAECVFEQSDQAFWTLEPILFRAQSELVNTARALDLAQQYAPSLDGARLKGCVDAGTGTDRVDRDVKIAQSLGLTGTPSVLVDGKLVSNPTFANIEQAIAAAGTGR
jgi:protein-disulfide isomerase